MRYRITKIQCELNNGLILQPDIAITEKEHTFNSIEDLEKYKRKLKKDSNESLRPFNIWRVENIYFTYVELKDEKAK